MQLHYLETKHLFFTAKFHFADGIVQVQPPSVWVIDLNTDKVVRRYEIPESIVEQGRGIISLKVDVDKNKCNEAHAYISDFLHQKIYVYRYGVRTYKHID